MDNKMIKKVIPVKGSLRKKFLKELYKDSQPIENIVKEPLKSPQENKIIIQKVENVKLEIITNSSKPRRISSLFTSANNQNSAENQTNTESSQVIMVNQDSEIVKEQQNVMSNIVSTTNFPLKLISAKIPENNCNSSIPLKMIRTIKAPKPKPNLLHRIHRVQTNKSIVPSTESCPIECDVRYEVLSPDMTMETETHVPNIVSPKNSALFGGFDEVSVAAQYDIGEWEELLGRVLRKDDAIDANADSAPNKSHSKSSEKLPSHETLIKIGAKISKELQKSPEKQLAINYSLNNSSYSQNRSSTSHSKEDMTQEKENSPKSSFSEKATSLTPKKLEFHPFGKTLSPSDIMNEKASRLVTSTPHPLSFPSTSKMVPSTSKKVTISETEPDTNEDWMEDILTVIGTSRIVKIDESLKQIPNLITGNFSAIETENVEFKLIIKHLLREMGVQSILDTVKFPSQNKSSSLSFSKDDDDEDDFSECFDDDSNEPTSFADDISYDHTLADDTCRNSSNPPENSLSLATSFGNIPSISFPSQSTFLEESSVVPDIEVQNPNTINNQAVIALSGVENLKRKSEEPGSSEPESKRTKKDRKLPWNLLLDGENRRNSLRSSSCDSNTEPIPKITSPGIKSLVSRDAYQTQALDAEESRIPPVPNLIENTPNLETNDNLQATESKASESSKLLLAPSRKLSTPPESPASPFSSEIVRRTKQKNFLSQQSENESDKDEVIKRTTRLKPLKPLSDDSDVEDTVRKLRTPTSSDDSDVPLVRKTSKTVRKNPKHKKVIEISKLIDDSSSISSDISDSSRKKVIRSRRAMFDSNSNEKYPTDNSFFRSSDKIPKFSRMRDESISDSQTNDVNGCSNDEESRQSSDEEASPKSQNSTIKSKMRDLIEKEKEKLSRKPPDTPAMTKEKRQSKKISPVPAISKKIFTQEPLETANESKVPYDDILQLIKSSVIGKRIGRASLKLSKEDEVRRAETLKKLQVLKFFRCGSCELDVTKHKWSEHFLSHGGMAWIDGFESPIVLSEWNEALRRTINSFKVYKQMQCPNCGEEKRSAIGLLSHISTCGESEEAIEEKKLTCAHCTERFLPFHTSLHKSKCTGMKTIIPHSNGNQDEEESEKEENSPDSFNVSGRQKRKAVKKAEKKFKKILEIDASDHLEIVSGQIKCHICGEVNFASQTEALEHIKKQHDSPSNDDFEASDSDASVAVDESTEESEGSSGVESSELEGSDEEIEGTDDEDKTKSSRKKRMPTTEPQEVKNGRSLISEYAETFRGKDMISKTIQWTKEIHDAKWKVEFLPQLIPRLLSTTPNDPKTVLHTLNFNLKSAFFSVQQTDSYSLDCEVNSKKEWKQLEIGENRSSKQSATTYCGGSVSAIDWAPSNSDLNFLAVACNSETKGIGLNLDKPIQSCVQIHEVKHLKNENFKGFEESSRLCYVLIIENGPVWSVKFHPSQSNFDERIGILAVATSNQTVLIYSLPHQTSKTSTVLTISPNFVCNLKRGETFFNHKYLQQVTRLSWFLTNDNETLLAAGYVSGLVSVWNITNADETHIYPQSVIQAHTQSITALDFKATESSIFHLVTASFDRLLKVFTFDGSRWHEISSHYASSRVLCTEWWLHWPGLIVGLEDCFSYGSIIHRQPMEFGSRNTSMLAISTPIIHFNINHWLNCVLFVSDSGDVLGCQPGQMLQTFPKDKWSYFNFTMYSSTDFNKISIDGKEEIALVFSDFKTATRQPKSYRQAPTDRINELLINQVCFNRNEKSYNFYALGYETGFVRIRYLKNSK